MELGLFERRLILSLTTLTTLTHIYRVVYLTKLYDGDHHRDAVARVFDGNWPSVPVSVATRLKKPPLRIHLRICIGFQRCLRHPRKTTLRKDLKPGPGPGVDLEDSVQT